MFCKKVKLKSFYKCVHCNETCHRKCFKKYLQSEQRNEPEELETTRAINDIRKMTS